MARQYKAIKITKEGFLTDEKGTPIICPIRDAGCSINCAWFSTEGVALHCQNAVLGVVGGKPVRSFHLHTGPLIYNLDKSSIDYDLKNPSGDGL